MDTTTSIEWVPRYNGNDDRNSIILPRNSSKRLKDNVCVCLLLTYIHLLILVCNSFIRSWELVNVNIIWLNLFHYLLIYTHTWTCIACTNMYEHVQTCNVSIIGWIICLNANHPLSFQHTCTIIQIIPRILND